MPLNKSALGAIGVAALLILAGCGGSVSNGTPAATPGEDGAAADGGTIEFYISDEQNAIDDFRHLNVTVTRVGFHRVGDADEEEDDEEEPEAEATPENETTTTNQTTATETTTAQMTATETMATETATPEQEAEGEGEGDGGGKWVEHEVSATVDLTELRGANATKIDTLAAPNGTYDKVFVYVDGINATLKNGKQVNVKLPSSKLHINKRFTVGDGETVEFVYDLSIHKAGKSGKYILRPVVSQSGTGEQVEIEEKNEDDSEEREREQERENETETETENETEVETENESTLNAEFVGQVEANETAELKVTDSDGPVANATVVVNGETVGTTDADGRITFTVPNAEELEVEVTKGNAETELERDLSGGGGDSGGDGQ